MRKVSLVATLLLGASILTAPAVAGDKPGTHMSRAELELSQARRLLGELEDDVKNLTAEGYAFIPAERYIDAQVYFDLKHYEKAALLLTSLLEDPRFKGDKRYYDGMKLLGISAYNMGNLQGAHRQFEKLLAAGVYKATAITYLIEIAARLQRLDELTQLVTRIDESAASEGLLYAKGKALFVVGRHGDAVTVLRRIPISSPEGMKSHYVSGASLVALKRNADARRMFELVVKEKGRDVDGRKVQELAYLALGRLAYESGEFSSAADFYQRIPRKSEYFEQALFEVTHVHLRWAAQKEDPHERFTSYSKAEELLDILVGITKNPDVAREARVLRGRISMFLEKYEQARESYQEVIDQFASTSAELTDIASSPESIDRFFEAMIRGGDTARELDLFVSREVVEWMRVQPSLGRVVEVLMDVSRQRTALEEAKEIYQQLTYSLDQQAARELFPGFSDAWLKSLEIENRLLEADRALLEYEKTLAGTYLTGSDVTRADQMNRAREALQSKLASAPRTVGAYRARSQNTMNDLRTLSKDVDEQILRIEKIREQINAMQRLLKEVKYKGSTMLQVKDEDSLDKEIRAEGGRLVSLMKEAEKMRSMVEKEMLVVEVGDPLSVSERDVKVLLWKQHREEAAFYIDVRDNMKPSVQRGIDKANSSRREILRLLDALRMEQRRIDKKAQKQIVYYKKILAREKVLLDQRERELKETERDALRFARRVGSVMLLEAKEDLVKAVVEADLGIVDLAWKRKQVETERIQVLQKEKAEVVEKLRAELREIMGDEEEEKGQD